MVHVLETLAITFHLYFSYMNEYLILLTCLLPVHNLHSLLVRAGSIPSVIFASLGWNSPPNDRGVLYLKSGYA
jgi:hypothetical protein